MTLPGRSYALAAMATASYDVRGELRPSAVEVGVEAGQEAVDVAVVVVRRQADAETAGVVEAQALGRLVGVEGACRGVDALAGEVPGDVARLLAVEGHQERR